MTTDIIPFEFESQAVRVIDRDGEPWFVLADVCQVLEIGNPSQAATRLDDDEQHTLINNEGHSGRRGGAQSFTIINESGLYSLVLTSRKPAAKRFKKWVTADVLPTIRKTGAYGTQHLTRYDASVIGNIVKNCTGVVLREQLADVLAEQKRAQESQGRALAVFEGQMKALTALVQPSAPGMVIRYGKSAGEILASAGFIDAPKNLAKWFGNRLEHAGCRVEGNGHTGTTYYRLFDPDKAEAYLRNGGKSAVEMKIAERRGQGALPLAPRRGAHITSLPEGVGAIMLNGEPVYFNARDITINEGERAVIITRSGDVKVDACRMTQWHLEPMGGRGAMAAPVMEVVPGLRKPLPVEWQCIVLGKVIENAAIRSRPVLAIDNATGPH